MPIYMYQAAYTAESWAAQLKKPENRVETVGRKLCEASGGKLLGAWYCFGDYDFVLVADMPSNQSMTALALAALPAEMREILVLREIQDLPYKQIAAVLDLPIGTVMSRLARARERMAADLRGRLGRREHGLPDL
jgi:uncharacterized protein with GYD domain